MSLSSIAIIQPPPPQSLAAPGEISVARLTAEAQMEVLAFLSARPLHTVALAGFIRDNGLVSPFNRGTFYGCRNGQGELEGVALIGHATLFETRTPRALAAFAECAQSCQHAHMIMGEQQQVEEFWAHYSSAGQAMRLACRELLFELRWPVEAREEINDLRLATPADLDLVMPVQAEMAQAESGVNPLTTDPVGFRQRCLRRIEMGRTWVCVVDGQLLFKAEVFAETPEVNYLEGIWVSPHARGTGLGLRCASQLARNLLQRTRALCLLVNETNTEARSFYQRAGYKLRGIYDTFFVQPRA
jgi:ribosomal protein S18 acetylase RimI-like enzyme